MFLRCSYFLANLSLNVLINMVLTQKKECKPIRRCLSVFPSPGSQARKAGEYYRRSRDEGPERVSQVQTEGYTEDGETLRRRI